MRGVCPFAWSINGDENQKEMKQKPTTSCFDDNKENVVGERRYE